MQKLRRFGSRDALRRLFAPIRDDDQSFPWRQVAVLFLAIVLIVATVITLSFLVARLVTGQAYYMATAVSPRRCGAARADGDRFGQEPLPRDDRDVAAAADGDEHHLAGDSCVVFTAALRTKVRFGESGERLAKRS